MCNKSLRAVIDSSNEYYSSDSCLKVLRPKSGTSRTVLSNKLIQKINNQIEVQVGKGRMK